MNSKSATAKRDGNSAASSPTHDSVRPANADKAEPGPIAVASHCEKTSPDDRGPQQALTRAIEAQRQNLSSVRAVLASNVSLLRDAEGMEAAGADIGYCCEVIHELLDPIVDRLRLLASDAEQDAVPPDRRALESTIRTAQHQLYRVHSVTLVVAHALQTEKDEYAANLRLVFVAIGKMLQEALTALDTAALNILRK